MKTKHKFAHCEQCAKDINYKTVTKFSLDELGILQKFSFTVCEICGAGVTLNIYKGKKHKTKFRRLSTRDDDEGDK